MKQRLLSIVAMIAVFVSWTWAQYSNATPNNPDPGPYAEQAANNGFNGWHFLYATIGVIVVIFILGQFVVGWRNPFAKKKPRVSAEKRLSKHPRCRQVRNYRQHLRATNG
jgi:hypothetical protein